MPHLFTAKSEEKHPRAPRLIIELCSSWDLAVKHAECAPVWRLEPDKCHAQQKKPGKKLKNLNVSKAEGWRRNCGQKMRGENRAKRAKGNTPGLRQQVRRPELPKSPCKDVAGHEPIVQAHARERCSHQLHEDAGTTTESPHIVLVQHFFA